MGEERINENSAIRNNAPDLLHDGRYKIGAVIGKGGFSVVYDATDTTTGQRVAIKECTVPEERERFIREATLLEKYAGEDAIVG